MLHVIDMFLLKLFLKNLSITEFQKPTQIQTLVMFLKAT